MWYQMNRTFATKCLTFLMVQTALNCCLKVAHAANILAIFPVVAKSHYAFNEAIMRTLHGAGHNVTIICSPDAVTFAPTENYTILPIQLPQLNATTFGSVKTFAGMPLFAYFKFGMPFAQKLFENFIKLESLQNIMSANSAQFDVLFYENAPFSQILLQLSDKLNIPAVATQPVRYSKFADDVLANPSHPAITPSIFHYVPTKMNFHQRLRNTLNYINLSLLMWLFVDGSQRLTPEEPTVPMTDNERGVSLLFQNGHPALLPRPMIPAIIDVGGIHLQPPGRLPQKIQKFMDEANAGVILFSLGTLSRGTSLSPRMLNAFKNAFAKVPQRVIWKYEGRIDELSNNVMIMEWLPQREILAHKNIKVFINHCGIGGIYEAIDSSVPLVMVPVHGDQLANAASLEEREVGVHLDVLTLTENEVLNAINTVVNDSRYRENMKKLSLIFNDRPMSSQESIVYWTEYVIRHRGAYHLRTAAYDMPFYQYILLDVVAAVLATFASLIFIIRFILKTITKWLCSRRKLSTCENKKKK